MICVICGRKVLFNCLYYLFCYFNVVFFCFGRIGIGSFCLRFFYGIEINFCRGFFFYLLRKKVEI